MSVKFKCLECGACCRNLLIEFKINDFRSWKLGLFLMPDEISLFPEEMLSPMWGVGLKGRSRLRPATIGVLQLNVDVCPHLTKDNKCRIYDKRPMVCRAHPLSVIIRRSRLDAIEASVDTKCYFAKQLPTGKTKLSNYFDDDLLKANVVCSSYLDTMLQNAHFAWLFDLAENKWKRL